MAGDITLLRGSWQTMMTTELNSLATVTGAVQATGTNAAFDNTAVAGTGLFFWGDFELQVTFPSAATVGQAIDFYLIPLSSTGGTTYWDGSATVRQPSLFIGSVAVAGGTSLQILGFRGVPLPPQKFIISVLNSTGVSFASSGNTVKFFPYGEAYT